MKRFIAVLCAAAVLMACASGCQKKAPEGVTVFVDGYGFGFTVTDVGQNDEGKTTVTMQMEPVEGEDGKLLTDALQIMRVATMFLMSPYIVVDGERLNASDDGAKVGLGGSNNDGRLISNYTYAFDTDKKPDELWLAPAGHEEDAEWHYQIDTKNYSIIKSPEFTE